ncbi:hypothetical protein Salat_0330700 [Sesamum alatum]|uniref:Uncharacterized protein n=1 Tax=Sesamum alatum TaxID=300844 RepID=A0AAE1Z1U1_9LAMI|nr:hypothetical protein Salat_0330700 [Sesamum alatum]
MAAMSIAKNAILNLSKSFSQKYPSIPLRSKVSRVCFTSASRYSEGGKTNDDRRKEYSPYNADEAVQEPGGTDVQDTMDKAKEKTREMKEKAKESAGDMRNKASDAAAKAADSAYDTKEKAKDKAQEMNEKSKEKLGSMADKAYEMREKAKDAAGDMADKTKEYADDAKDKTKEYAHGAKETTKEAAGNVVDTAQSLGEKAKQTVQGAWDAAKDTTHKIKEKVVGKSDDVDLDDYMEDHVRKQAEDREKAMDEDVVELRRQGGEKQQDQDKL